MHSTLTKAADSVQIYKDVVRNVAKQYNKVANFMPKPIFEENNPRNGGDNGSGMHVSISLWSKSSSSRLVKTFSMMMKIIMQKSASKEDTLSVEC